jgi:hypothetical protein
MAATASADRHRLKVSEVFPGTSAAADKAFVELKAVAPGQTNLAGHAVTIYNGVGTLAATVPLTGPVASGQSNRTVLLGDIDVTNRDYEANIGTLMNRDGGAACFGTVDCVAWGAFTGFGALPSPVGTPAPAIPAPDMTSSDSLVRLESANCPTFLDPLDDTGNSAADFTIVAAESPTPNSAPVAGLACDASPPQTKITRAPRKRTTKTKAKVRFRSNEPGSVFKCKLDRAPYAPCESPFRTTVKVGKHRFRVRATDPSGNTDPTPAKAKYRRISR